MTADIVNIACLVSHSTKYPEVSRTIRHSQARRPGDAVQSSPILHLRHLKRRSMEQCCTTIYLMEIGERTCTNPALHVRIAGISFPNRKCACTLSSSIQSPRNVLCKHERMMGGRAGGAGTPGDSMSLANKLAPATYSVRSCTRSSVERKWRNRT
ncbi:uncharacterized protein BO66DRAFT_128539 [Aspergillus aculeatinus CBS 121060]|uniref:Uncharacterized protein n=1 Tax=Aspergillus aculeatinus CBS 121060 TaxID=1448322 RepID=A0ACD1H484_9EURO|nr:hypothetical protein BO66DRAFT_128539 [Aspergillus aculeatinus CBS 121060]RAH68383.1 hypothetical protein BO66DRAFT_128539 [Aspergillus aculeatinus CBS 121060]